MPYLDGRPLRSFFDAKKGVGVRCDLTVGKRADLDGAFTDLISGQVQVMFSTRTGSIGYIRGGAIG
jgi:hypothetical protein